LITTFDIKQLVDSQFQISKPKFTKDPSVRRQTVGTATL
jgi:hypothetical protein